MLPWYTELFTGYVDRRKELFYILFRMAMKSLEWVFGRLKGGKRNLDIGEEHLSFMRTTGDPYNLGENKGGSLAPR